MNENRSVATIDGPEFIDIHPYNPLISECQIKVMYVGKNRNGSYIDKNTAIQMANSLPGCPIVAAYREDIEDFGDHGEVIKIEDGEVKFSCKTVPYGFVAPDARVWFQKFVDTDKFGNDVEHEYMMTTGYLWTGQFPEAQAVIDEGKGQSMELDSDHLDGEWANDAKSGMDFFIINDALFSKLCILGDDVEPCFEGASVTAVEKQFSNDNEFAHSLYDMMKELKFALESKEGGSLMQENQDELQESETEFVVTSTEEQPEPVEEEVAANAEEIEEVEEPSTDEAEEPVTEEKSEVVEEPVAAESVSEDIEEFAKKDEDAPSDDDTDSSEADENDTTEEEDEEEKKPASKHSLVDDEAIMAELEELRQFKHRIESAEKDEVINKYHMLSDEDKAEVVAHKDEYTLQQIDEKLALVYVNKNVDFSTVDGLPEAKEEVEPSILSFSLDDTNLDNAEPVDDIQAALRELNR